MVFQESFQWGLKVFEISSKGIPEEFQRHFKDILRKFQWHLKKAS